MPSDAQLAANRRNAQHSTGPRTPEGKSICAKNAARHGRLADLVLLACEDRRQFIRHARRFHREFQPVGHLEVSLVNDMVAASWRRDRLGVLEARLMDHSYITIPAPLLPQPASDGVSPQPDAPQADAPQADAPHADHSPVAFRNALAYRELADTSKALPQLSRDAARHNRDFHKALATLLRLRAAQAKAQSGADPAIAPAIDPAIDPEDPYYQGHYDRPVFPPPADPEGTVPQQLLGLIRSVSTPETPSNQPGKESIAPNKSTACEGKDSFSGPTAQTSKNVCRPVGRPFLVAPIFPARHNRLLPATELRKYSKLVR